MLRELLVCSFLLAGSILMLFASLGLLRFADVLCRAHALGKATTFGVSLLIIGMWIHLNEETSGLKLSLILAFSLLTIPLASHLVALLLYRHRQMPTNQEGDTESEER